MSNRRERTEHQVTLVICPDCGATVSVWAFAKGATTWATCSSCGERFTVTFDAGEDDD